MGTVAEWALLCVCVGAGSFAFTTSEFRRMTSLASTDSVALEMGPTSTEATPKKAAPKKAKAKAPANTSDFDFKFGFNFVSPAKSVRCVARPESLGARRIC
jgi:hypothetical protein